MKSRFKILKNFIMLYTLLIGLINCNEKDTSKFNEVNIKTFPKKKENIVRPNNEIPQQLLSISLPKIKKQINNVTSTFLKKNQTLPYIKKNNPKYYGLYYLIVGQPDNVVGTMIIYDDKNPYIYKKNTDEFIEINLWKPGIKVSNKSLKVGMSQEQLRKKIPLIKKINKQIWVYEQDSLKAFFKIEKSKVSHIKIGLYDKKIDFNSIINNVEW